MSKTKQSNKAKKEKTKAEINALPQEKMEKEVKEKAPLLNKIFGVILVIIGLAAIFSIAVFFYFKYLRGVDAAELLPENKVIAYAQADILNSQSLKLRDLLSKYSAYSPENFKKLLSDFGDFETEIKPWLGTKFAIALLTPEKRDEKISTVLFVSTKSKKKTLEFFENLQFKTDDKLNAEEFEKNKIYGYPLSQSFTFAFIDKYVILSNSKLALQNIIHNRGNEKKYLSDNLNFVEIRNNLSASVPIFSYVDISNFSASVLKNPHYFPELWTKFSLISPVINIFKGSGVSLGVEGNRLVLQHYTSISKTQSKEPRFFVNSKKFKGKLLSYITPSASAVLAGLNLENQINKNLEILNEAHPAFQEVFFSILRAKAELYLGENTALLDGISPLFKNEYAFAIIKDEEGKNQYQFILSAESQESARRLEDLQKNILMASAFDQPQIREETDENGNKVQVMIEPQKKASQQEIKYLDYSIYKLNIPILPIPVYSAVAENVYLLSTSQKVVEQSLDMIGGNMPNLASVYKEDLNPALIPADELSVIKINEFADKFPGFKDYLEPFDTLISSKNTFDDGMSILHFVKIK